MPPKNDTVIQPVEREFEITRLFDAPRDLVWKAHTEAELLRHWWGPKGFKMLTCTVDLRPGGIFHYGMQSPDGSLMWGRFVYSEIIPQEKLVFIVSFSDKEGGITPHPMAQGWPAEILSTLFFSEKDGKTTLTMKGYPLNATESEIKMYNDSHAGMQQGFGGTYDQLDEYLAKVLR